MCLVSSFSFILLTIDALFSCPCVTYASASLSCIFLRCDFASFLILLYSLYASLRLCLHSSKGTSIGFLIPNWLARFLISLEDTLHRSFLRMTSFHRFITEPARFVVSEKGTWPMCNFRHRLSEYFTAKVLILSNFSNSLISCGRRGVWNVRLSCSMRCNT